MYYSDILFYRTMHNSQLTNQQPCILSYYCTISSHWPDVMISVHLVGFVSESIYFGLTTSITWFYLTRLLWRLAYLLTVHHACVAHRAALWRLTIPKFTVASRQRPVNQPIMNMNTKPQLVRFHETPWFKPHFVFSSLFLMGFCLFYIYIYIFCVCVTYSHVTVGIDI